MMDVYWRCYVVLDHLGDERADGVLETAYDLLLERAEMIEDTAVRQQFLQNIPVHREIMGLRG